MSRLHQIPRFYWVLVVVSAIGAAVWVSDRLYDWAPSWMTSVALLLISATSLGGLLFLQWLANRGRFDVISEPDSTRQSTQKPSPGGPGPEA